VSSTGENGGPLAGVAAVDMSTSYAGPTAAMYLADLGARVIKVERPRHGDDARGWGPPFVDGESAWFASANRNKDSIVLNLRTEQGRAELDGLLEGADVLVENLNPTKLAGLGLDPDTVRRRFPKLIYCALSGFGLTGPDAGLAGYDLIAQARSGLMSVTGPASGPPQRVSTALSDVVAGMCAALAVSAALVRQRMTGQGELVDVSLLDVDLALMAPRLAAYLAGGPEPAPSGGTDSVLATYQTFPTADRDIAIAIGNDAMWRRFCSVVELDALADDPGLATNADRQARRPELVAAISARLRLRSAAEWTVALQAAAIPCSLVQTLSEVVDDPQVRARGTLMPVPGSGGRLHTVHPPFRLGSRSRPRNERFPDLDSLRAATEAVRP
jgi:crotonobetainyl-CoA:carnitine CoA-transferase CaiB-like acyl-CoA transferase